MISRRRGLCCKTSRLQLELRRARRPQAPSAGRMPGEANADAPIGIVGTAADRRKRQSRRLCLWHDSRRRKRHDRWHWKWHQWHRKGPWCRKWHGRRRRKRHGHWHRKWHGRRRRRRHGRWRWRPLALEVAQGRSGAGIVTLEVARPQARGAHGRRRRERHRRRCRSRRGRRRRERYGRWRRRRHGRRRRKQHGRLADRHTARGLSTGDDAGNGTATMNV